MPCGTQPKRQIKVEGYVRGMSWDPTSKFLAAMQVSTGCAVCCMCCVLRALCVACAVPATLSYLLSYHSLCKCPVACSQMGPSSFGI